MARSKNSLTDVSPASGQLKSSFSNSERTQLNALKQTSGSLGNGAGNITGSVTNALQNFSYRDRSKLEIGGLFAEGLEKSGITTKNSGAVISSVVNSSIDNRKPFYRNTPTREIDLSIPSNRIPDRYKKSPTRRMKDKRELLVGKDDLNYNGLTFPSDLTKNAHTWMQLQLWTYTRPSSMDKGFTNPAENIYLPLPEDFTQEFAVNYGEVETGVFGAAAKQGVLNENIEQVRSNFESGGSITEGLSASREAIGKTLSEVGEYFFYNALNSTSPALGGLAGQEIGRVSNPHPSLFLQGVNLRQFSFTWKLVPRSEPEARIIKQIIALLKSECLPKPKDSFLTYPKMILPRIAGLGSQYKKSMMTGLSVNYSGEGTSAFFVDGNPVSVILTLNLQEAELYLNEDGTIGENQGDGLADGSDGGFIAGTGDV